VSLKIPKIYYITFNDLGSSIKRDRLYRIMLYWLWEILEFILLHFASFL